MKMIRTETDTERFYVFLGNLRAAQWMSWFEDIWWLSKIEQN